MNPIASTGTVPYRVLLATDLSPRCDRALDRAAQLTGEWRGELIALNVLDPTGSPDQALAWASGADGEQLMRVARQQLARDLAAVNVPASLLIVRRNNVAAAIRETAASTQASLVATAVSCNETLGRLLLGSTVEQLARSLTLPLLVVRNRVRGPYRRIVVATDFSESSRHALLVAAQRFPGRELTLYHAHALPMAGSTNASSSPGICVAMAETAYASFMTATDLPEGVKVRPVIECGAIETMLTRYVREQDIDLVVMGSHGLSGIMSLLLGSTAAKLLDWLPCDTLLVHEPRATVTDHPAANPDQA